MTFSNDPDTSQISNSFIQNTPGNHNLSSFPQVDNQRCAEPVTRESPHPHPMNACLGGTVRFPRAISIRVEFDPRCSTEKLQHCLTLTDHKVR